MIAIVTIADRCVRVIGTYSVRRTINYIQWKLKLLKNRL